MLNTDEKYKTEVLTNIYNVYKQDLLPLNHSKMLEFLNESLHFKPTIIFDIGSAVLHWERHAKRIWANSQIICFDAFSPLEQLYQQCNVKYHMACLSDKDGVEQKFYQNDMFFGGNSLFREIGYDNGSVFPKENYILKQTQTLDTIVKNNNYMYPDLIKIDAQGGELDILKGATECLNHATYLIVELQNVEYNEGAVLAPVVISYLERIGWTLLFPKFSDNGPDADYCFIKTNKAGSWIYSLGLDTLARDWITK